MLSYGENLFPVSEMVWLCIFQFKMRQFFDPDSESGLNRANWQEREKHLSEAYETVAGLHNDLGITEPLETHVRYFHDRPFRVIDADRFTAAIRNVIDDPEVARIPTILGSIDQFSHSTDLRSNPRLHKRLQSLYK